MAYGDLSFFLPQQQYYRNPGDYTSAMKNAALQKANYLAQLDVEMAQLDEAKRQFDKGLQEQKRSTNMQGYLENKQIGVAQDNANTNRAATYGQIALGAGKLGWDVFNEYGGRNWAEKIGRAAGWLPEEDSGITDLSHDFTSDQQYGSEAFDLDSMAQPLQLNVWDNAWEADPLLDYELDW